MSHARHVLWAAAIGLTLAAGVACSSMESSAFDGQGDDRPSADGGTGFPTSPDSDAGAFPRATGIVLVHAAAFPSFRLCFSNFPDLRPQPDSRVMPESNVVGVEIGSLVRLDPMTAPGTVYVIREERVRTAPENTNPPTCGELIADLDAGVSTNVRLQPFYDYLVATAIERPIGQDGVTVLAITGCGGAANLGDIGAADTNCEQPYDPQKGNLRARTFDLHTYPRAQIDKSIPVQLIQLSPELGAFALNGAPLSVAFGPLGGDAGTPDGGEDAGLQPVDVGGLYDVGNYTDLAFDQTGGTKIYGQLGFRVSAKNVFSTEQSLASVQDFSAPLDVPSKYYRTDSSYALLLLGDPTHTPSSNNYNPRRAVHFLAVPVIDPEPRDAGAPPESDGGTSDGG